MISTLSFPRTRSKFSARSATHFLKIHALKTSFSIKQLCLIDVFLSSHRLSACQGSYMYIVRNTRRETVKLAPPPPQKKGKTTLRALMLAKTWPHVKN